MLHPKATFVFKIAFVSVVSWLVGVVVYFLSLSKFYNETAGDADFWAVIFWSAFVSLFVFPLVYTPAMFALRRILHGTSPSLLFPLVGAAVFVVPTIFIVVLFGGGGSAFYRSMVSPEALLFYCMFAAVGCSFGLGFVWFFDEKR